VEEKRREVDGGDVMWGDIMAGFEDMKGGF
jgi:hypothetical protein